MMFKKILAAALSLLMMTSVVGCGTGGGGGGEKDPACPPHIDVDGDGLCDNCGQAMPPEKEPDGDPVYGTLKISDTYVWLSNAEFTYPDVEIGLNYSAGSTKEKLAYEYDESVIEIDAEHGTIKPLTVGSTEVRAYSEHYEAKFTVTCEDVDINPSDKAYSLTQHANGDPKNWYMRVNQFKGEWQAYGRNNMTTLFIGDSFFDQSGFWTSFAGDYSGKDALCFGIGSTQTYAWQTICRDMLPAMQPKNVVMNIGTNDLYDLRREADDVTSSLERLFTMMHDTMPSAKFYWFTINRRYGGGASEELEAKADEVIANFSKWAEGRKWITVVNSRAKYTADKTKPDLLHPNDAGYKLFMELLETTDINIVDSD